MSGDVSLRARPYWTAATALRHPDTGSRFMRGIALGHLRPAVEARDGLLNWRAALALEQTGNGPRIPAPLPGGIEPEPAS